MGKIGPSDYYLIELAVCLSVDDPSCKQSGGVQPTLLLIDRTRTTVHRVVRIGVGINGRNGSKSLCGMESGSQSRLVG